MNYSLLIIRIRALSRCILIFSVLHSGIFESAHAQKLTITDDQNRKGLSDVAVFNKQQSISEMTNEKGVVDLKNFNDLDTLVFQHPAYVDLYFTKAELKSVDYKLYMMMEIQMLDEVVMSATKSAEKKSDVPVRMEVITPLEIGFLNPQTTADMLQKTGSISVQKSQAGGGSPNLRGFEANKVLLVVDGVRMNNAIYRSGHLQNVITIDQASLERTEVIFGPGSVIYGSDAMGGVMHFYTQKPELAKSGTAINSKINVAMRYSSANKEQTTHFTFQVGLKKFGILTSLTHHDFGNTKMGTVRSSVYPDFGKSLYYLDRTENGTDTMIKSEDPNLQLNTDYRQVNLLQKIYYQANPNLDFELNIQYSSSSVIHRFDRLNDIVNDTLKYAEWHYGPQKRLLSAFTTHIKSNSRFFDNAMIILAYQKIEEDRITRKFGNNLRAVREEDVAVYSLNMDFNKKIDSARSYVYGVEAILNDVQSSAHSEFAFTSAPLVNITTRYPDGGSTQQQYAAYFNYKWKANPKVVWSAGIRYNHILMNLKFIDTSTYSLPFQEINASNSAFNGSVGLIIRPIENLQFNLVAATGFRSPNVDDMGKVFAKNEYVTVPNASLKPEYIYSAELGVQANLLDQRLTITLNGFYSYLTNAIVQREYQLNGQDSLVYDGEILKIVANTNVGRAEIYGVSGAFELKLIESLSLKSSLTYTHGEDRVNNVPLSHIPPAFGRTAISHKVNKGKYLRPLELSIYSYYAAWKRISDYGSSVDNLDEATADGTPAWYTLNFSSSYTLKFSNKNGVEMFDFGPAPSDRIVILQISVENLLDQHYKTFSSGVSAPGRNFILSLNAFF